MPEYFELLEDLDFVSNFGLLESSFTETLEHLLVAEDIMTKEPVTIQEEASLFKALALIHRYKVRHLPVLRGEKLVGVVTRTDIIRAIFED
ncbi:CBS domain-containing protein [Candidatus Aerophobetes bacterium]|nr:CBS domain-containing protein [Candidatus Aerophobetes bacterium]